jgi:hypothetical protein
MLFIALQVALWGLMIIATIALGIRAYGKRQKEGFEKRDN